MNLKLPNGQFFIPSENNLNSDLGYNALIFGPKTTFKADQVSGNIDYNVSGRDRLTRQILFPERSDIRSLRHQPGRQLPAATLCRFALGIHPEHHHHCAKRRLDPGLRLHPRKSLRAHDRWLHQQRLRPQHLRPFQRSRHHHRSGRSEYWQRPRHRPFQQLRQRRHVPEHLRRFDQIFLDGRPPHHRRRRADRSHPAQHPQQEQQSGLARFR